MTEIEKARALFNKSGLSFPVLPKKLELILKEIYPWCYSTRPLNIGPYYLDGYLEEARKGQTQDFALIAHSGHGVNSYAIQYYLVYGSLHMFLFLGWGGAYMDNQKETAKINECFSLADQITKINYTIGKPFSDKFIIIVASDFYGSYWSSDWKKGTKKDRHLEYKKPQQVLGKVLDWIYGEY